MEISTGVHETEWIDFLARCSTASIYHTPEWKRFLEKMFDYQPQYLFATDDCGNLIGLLPLFHVKSRITGDRLCSLPFSHLCGPIGEKGARTELIGNAQILRSTLKDTPLEIRSSICISGFHSSDLFSTYILDLSSQSEEVWKRLDHGSVRRTVKKARSLGVAVEISKEREDLLAFYEINSINKKNLGVPCHPYKFFKNLFFGLEQYVSLYVAKYKGEIIAGGVMERFKGSVLYGYGAADPSYLHVHPYHALIWKSIEDACRDGYSEYDFGRVSHDNTGLIQFKKRWGTREKKLCYCSFPGSPKPSLADRDSSLYRFGNTVIHRMPMPVYKKFSDIVFSHFG
jgi:hypothetical protein